MADDPDLANVVDDLIAEARRVALPFQSSEDCRSGDVGAALVTVTGNVYSGVCIDTHCGLGFCAEHAAVAEMLKAGEAEIRAIAAVSSDGDVLAPCGRCRELLWQVHSGNTRASVVMPDRSLRRLADLLPGR